MTKIYYEIMTQREDRDVCSFLVAMACNLAFRGELRNLFRDFNNTLVSVCPSPSTESYEKAFGEERILTPKTRISVGDKHDYDFMLSQEGEKIKIPDRKILEGFSFRLVELVSGTLDADVHLYTMGGKRNKTLCLHRK
ncbi:hypothetical protein HY450_00595 [Candidatus Pacearchaeota archaeon]|nr:hypothetical protein [Candidatus Pacearchaeota archaeon]